MSPQDSCIDCHVPRYGSSDIAHTASTDHRIVRRIGQRPAPAIDLDGASFVDFYHDRFPEGDRQAERNLGLGLVKMLTAGLLRPQRHGPRALLLLESARAEYPHDLELRRGKAMLLGLLGRPAEAAPEVRAVLAQRPGDWRLLAQAATAAQAEGATDRAIDDWREAVRINPLVPDFQVSLIGLLIRAGKLDEARLRCRELLRLDPFNVSGRQAWVGFLLREGKKGEARADFDLIRQLAPPDLAEREKWFEQQVQLIP
jgi:tetratricopeptide (TPR) repeat protein